MTTPPGSVVDLAAHKIKIEFQAVISGWDDSVKCEITTNARTRCARAAQWRVDAHGCERRLMCTAHLRRYERQIESVLQTGKSAQCPLCSKRFRTIEAVRTVARL